MTDISMLIAEWQAEIAGLRAAWEQAVDERDTAKAEIKEWRAYHEEQVAFMTEHAEKAQAEIARLREALQNLHDNVVHAWPSLAELGPVAAARAALKPDTGEEK